MICFWNRARRAESSEKGTREVQKQPIYRHNIEELIIPLYCAECLPHLRARQTTAVAIWVTSLGSTVAAVFSCSFSKDRKGECDMKKDFIKTESSPKFVIGDPNLIKNNKTAEVPDKNSRGRHYVRAFTLIELLVVVLIIGILSSMALPQYQKTVEKSKATQAFSIIRSLASAQESFYLSNSTYATTLDNLEINIPWSDSNFTWLNQTRGAGKSNGDWIVEVYKQAVGNGIAIGRITGPYTGAGFVYLLDNNKNSNYPSHEIICMERRNNTDFPFTQARGNYCNKFFPQLYFVNVDR